MAGVSSATTGLRSYSPDLGRWINRDPIEERGGVGLYVFAVNMATLAVDVTGLMLFPVVALPPSMPSPPNPSPFGSWDEDARISKPEGEKLLCILDFLGLDEPLGSPMAQAYFALETLIAQGKAWKGTSGSPTKLGEALAGQIIVRSDLPMENLLATLMHETVHVLLTNGPFEDGGPWNLFPDPAGTMENVVLDAIDVTQATRTRQPVCCQRADGSTFYTTWTKFDRVVKVCGFPDVCEKLGTTLIGSGEPPEEP